MSILIRGMEMPTKEEQCKFYQDAPFRAPYCVIKGVCVGLEDCPLIEIPPHGRLIDADALKKKHHWTDDFYETEYVEVEDIDAAPTIIEAEEGE